MAAIHSRNRKLSGPVLLAVLLASLSGCGQAPIRESLAEPRQSRNEAASSKPQTSEDQELLASAGRFVNGLENGNIHYSLYLPKDYSSDQLYPLYIHLPGYEGLYFQGEGMNMLEGFPQAAVSLNPEMIVVSAQLNGWDEQSAEDTIALTESLMDTWSIDPERVFLQGLSGGGETGSLAVDLRPDLFAGFLAVSSRWDGGWNNVARAGLPIYLAIAQNDTYYSSAPFAEAYEKLKEAYLQAGWSEEETDQRLHLDIRDDAWVKSQGYSDAHAAGNAFSQDQKVMNWLLSQRRTAETNESE